MAKRSADTGASERRGPGRPRDEQADHAILRATLQITGEVGVGAMTIAAVAQRAGVGKATIYRRWPTKAGLVLAALTALQDRPPEPDTGSLRGDLLEYQRLFASLLAGPGGDWVPHMLAESTRHAELRTALTAFVARRRSVLHTLLERGVERGELRADIDLDLAQELFSGPLFFRATMAGLPITGGVAEPLIDLVLEGLAPPATPAGPHKRGAKGQRASASRAQTTGKAGTGAKRRSGAAVTNGAKAAKAPSRRRSGAKKH